MFHFYFKIPFFILSLLWLIIFFNQPKTPPTGTLTIFSPNSSNKELTFYMYVDFFIISKSVASKFGSPTGIMRKKITGEKLF